MSQDSSPVLPEVHSSLVVIFLSGCIGFMYVRGRLCSLTAFTVLTFRLAFTGSYCNRPTTTSGLFRGIIGYSSPL